MHQVLFSSRGKISSFMTKILLDLLTNSLKKLRFNNIGSIQSKEFVIIFQFLVSKNTSRFISIISISLFSSVLWPSVWLTGPIWLSSSSSLSTTSWSFTTTYVYGKKHKSKFVFQGRKKNILKENDITVNIHIFYLANWAIYILFDSKNNPWKLVFGVVLFPK